MINAAPKDECKITLYALFSFFIWYYFLSQDSVLSIWKKVRFANDSYKCFKNTYKRARVRLIRSCQAHPKLFYRFVVVLFLVITTDFTHIFLNNELIINALINYFFFYVVTNLFFKFAS